MAAVPLERRCRIRCANPVSRWRAPSSVRSVRAGSAFETTVPARIASPLASSTPETRSPSSVMRATGLPVRTVAPCARAAAASASVTAPMPPSGSHGRFVASSDCPLSRCSSARTELFDRGPRLVPSTASRASAPFNSGVSKVSSSTSKTLMPAMRRNSRMSSRPRRRISRPSIAAAIVSERPPPSILGGRRPCCFARIRAKRSIRA